ncbi:KTSC domain-containing protein [Ensifer sp. 4252]|uniref:KTSC domain-containing protein n=1 Tax=Ensifer sp. 4252 TaxID=3373915 RepID=UPI003D1D3238
MIQKFEYDPKRRILSVWLLPSGRRYDYHEVPADTFENFKSAFAKGKFFNAFIRNQFAFRIGDTRDP